MPSIKRKKDTLQRESQALSHALKEHKRRRDRSSTQETIAADLRVSSSLVGQWVRGETAVPDSYLVQLADRCKFNPTDIRPEISTLLQLISTNAPKWLEGELAERPAPYISDIMDRTVRVPFLDEEGPESYSEATRAANRAIFDRGYHVVSYHWLKTQGLRIPDVKVAFAETATMEPAIRRHDMVLIDISQVDALTNGVYLFRRHRENALYRVINRPDGSVTVTEDNRQSLQFAGDYNVTAEELAKMPIVGRVIERCGML